MPTYKPYSKLIAVVVAAALSVLMSLSAAQAWTESVLHTFTGGSDGSGPYAPVIMDQSANLFGTTVEGGGPCRKKRGCGTVFKVAPDGTETVLYAFKGGHDGRGPEAGLAEDQSGNLYGTTAIATRSDGSTVFEVTQQGVHTILHTFSGGSDGGGPLGSLIFDASGNLYGTTAFGGSNSVACYGGCGTVFEITSGGVFSVLYSFQAGTDGKSPRSGLIFDGAGNLYGTTSAGGNGKCFNGYGCGTVFKLTPDGIETVLYAFHGGGDGSFPSGNLVFDASGNLYGTTEGGGGKGCYNGSGCGTVFELAPDGTETVLSRFNRTGGPTHPVGGVVLDGNGNLFGASSSGGSAGCGTAFKLAPGHEAKAVYSFKCGKDGGYPAAGLLRGASGEFYGTTSSDGKRFGVVFELKRK